MNPVRIFLNIVELRTKVVSLATFACASLGAAVFLREQGASFPWIDWALMLAAVLAVDMGTTGFNTYFDFVKGVDLTGMNREDDKVLVHHGVSPSTAFFTSVTLFSAALVLGFIISLRTSWLVAAAGFTCMLVGFFYSAGPRPISHTPLGELFSGGFLGCVLFCISWYVLTGTISARPLLLSLPLGLMISAILTTNNNCDMESDKKAGRKTLTILIGGKAGRALLWFEYAMSVSLLFYMQYRLQIYPKGFLPVSALLIVLIGGLLISMVRRGFSAGTKGASMRAILRAFMLGAILQLYPWFITLIRISRG